MPVPLWHVGRVGRLDVQLTARDGRTTIRHAYCEVPSKITRLLHSPAFGMAHLMLMHCTAGLFGGDRVDVSVLVEPGARVLVTQQSATKVHPSTGGLVAAQRTHIRVEAGGELYLVLEPVIPFAGAWLDQQLALDVACGARLCVWEGLMGGRLGHGEAWRFDRCRSETSLRVDGRLVHLDRFDIEPGRDDPTSPWAMGACGYLGTGLCFASGGGDGLAEQLHAALPDVGVDAPAPDVTLLRSLTRTGPEYQRHQAAFTAACLSSLAAGTNDRAVP